MTLRRHPFLLITLFAVCLYLVACGESQGTRGEMSRSVSELTPAGSEIGSDAVSSVGDGSSVATIPSGGLDPASAVSLPSDLAAMLSNMGRYQMDVRVTFQGLDSSGEPVTFELVSRETIVGDSASSRLDVSATGADGREQIESVSLIHVGDLAFLYVPGIGCVSDRSDRFADDMKLPLDPRLMLKGLADAEVVDDSAMVDGTASTEFDFDGNNLPWSPAGNWVISGAAYVDNISGLLSRVTMTVSGQGDLLNEGRALDGNYEIVVDITANIDDQTLAVPDACGAALRYPVPDGAYDITAIEDLLAFKIRMPLLDVVDFYVREMPKMSWQLTAEPDLFEELAIMSFQQGDAPLMITGELDTDSGVVSVLISP